MPAVNPLKIIVVSTFQIPANSCFWAASLLVFQQAQRCMLINASCPRNACNAVTNLPVGGDILIFCYIHGSTLLCIQD